MQRDIPQDQLDAVLKLSICEQQYRKLNQKRANSRVEGDELRQRELKLSAELAQWAGKLFAEQGLADAQCALEYSAKESRVVAWQHRKGDDEHKTNQRNARCYFLRFLLDFEKESAAKAKRAGRSKRVNK